MSFPRYPKYKDSGVEWLGEVPEGWEVNRLKRISPSMTVGIVVNPSTFVADDGLPFIYGGDIREGVIDWAGARRIDADASRANSKTQLRAGDLLTVRVGAPGVTAVVPPECDGGNCASVMLIRQGTFNSQWLCYAMNTRVVRFQVEVVQYGAAQEQFNISHAVDFCVPTPPREEQDRIAQFLDREAGRIDELVAEQRRLMELLKEKRQAVISHAVTKGLNPRAPMKPSNIEWLGDVPEHWEAVRLRHLFKLEKRQDQSDKQVLSCYRDFGVVAKDSRDDNMNKTPEDLSLYQLVNREDLVVNKMKAWQGSLGISDLEGITSPDYAVFTPQHTECPAFLHLILRSDRMVSVYRSISNGIRPAQWRVEPDAFLSLPVFLPPEQEQIQLVDFVTEQTSRFDALAAEAQKAIDLLQERRTALISAAVTGQIDVRKLAAA